MDRLRAEEHALLNVKVLKLLVQNKITTIVEFLLEDTQKLAVLTRLNFDQILTIRNDILAKYSAPIVRGSELYKTFNIIDSKLKTGISSLDAILGGGIPNRCITEICGLADSGKTQLCFALAINCCKDNHSNVLYIDTKGDFSAVRIQKILEASGASHQEMASVMNKIKIIRVWSMSDIVKLFVNLISGEINVPDLHLIIVDSLPALMFQHVGDEAKAGLTLLNSMVNKANKIAKNNNICIICVNILARWVEPSSSDIDDTELTLEGATTNAAWIEKKYRCLGRYWQHIPALVLLLEKFDSENSAKVNVTVTKSAFGKGPLSCYLNLNEFGVT